MGNFLCGGVRYKRNRMLESQIVMALLALYLPQEEFLRLQALNFLTYSKMIGRT